jgi:ketosteroid isomerase-like protein
MKQILSFGIAASSLLTFTTMICVAQDQASSAATEQEVLQAVERYRTAILKKDTTALEQIWADDYTFVNGAGDIFSKQQRLENIKSGATSLDSITQGTDVKVRTYRDTAVVTSTVTIQGQYSGKEAGGDYRSMLVWVKSAADWQLIANQLTPLSSK